MPVSKIEPTVNNQQILLTLDLSKMSKNI